MTIAEFGRAWRAGEITSEQATERCLANIEGRDRNLNAFILVLADDARRRARDADRELAEGCDLGPLHGVPISIKDLMDVQGTPTTAASRVRTAQPATADAPAIANLRTAGAVFVGKTNLHEYALGTTSEDSAFGAVRNPIRSRAFAWRIERWIRRQRRRRHGVRQRRHRHRRLDPHSRIRLRHCRTEAVVRRSIDRRRDRVVTSPGSCRPACEIGRRRVDGVPSARGRIAAGAAARRFRRQP